MRYARPRKYVKVSRYKIYRQIVENDGTTYLETVNQTPVIETESDIYHEVDITEENRLDIIANRYYNDPSLWWVIAMANDLVDPFLIKVGTIVRIPNFLSLTQWKGALYSRI